MAKIRVVRKITFESEDRETMETQLKHSAPVGVIHAHGDLTITIETLEDEAGIGAGGAWRGPTPRPAESKS